MLAKNMKKRSLALLMTFVMVLSLLPVSALAKAIPSGSAGQIGQYLEYNSDGTPTGGKLGESKKDLGNGIQMQKDISATDQENQFEITLTVSTTENLKNIPISPDAAVVLVLDSSESMTWPVSGSEHVTDTDHQRLTLARSAACKFVDNFSKDAAGAKRMVAVVDFNENAKTDIGWTDVTMNTGSASVKSAINGFNTAGWTNTEGGLQLAYNLLGQDDVKDISSRHVILLTDGEPNTTIKGDARDKTDKFEGIKCYGNAGVKGAANAAAAVAERIKTDRGSLLHTVAFATGTKTIYDDVTAGAWLESIASPNCFQNASDGEELTFSFEKIMALIKELQQVWTVTDPMPDYISATLPDGSTSSAAIENNQLTWNLLGDEPETSTTGSGNTAVTTYTYTLTYDIMLDNMALTPNTYYPTNDATKLTYSKDLLDEGGSLNPDAIIEEDYFNIPTVKGYFSNLTFTKVDSVTNCKLQGAKFALIVDDDGNGSSNWEGNDTADHRWFSTAYSTQNGNVKFTGIPSGHSYILKEVQAPSKYQLDEGAYPVSVEFGKTTVDTTTDSVWSKHNSSLIFKDGLAPGSRNITIEKKWMNEGGLAGFRPDSITVEVIGTVSTGIFKSKTVYDQQYTLSTNPTGTEIPAADNGDGAWTADITGLPVRVTTAENYGKDISYQVKELDSGSNYQDIHFGISYCIGKDSTVTIKNLFIGTTDITVTKNWLTPETGSFYASVALLADGIPVGWATLEGKSDSHTFGNYPLVNPLNNTPIQYTVEEVGVKHDSSFASVINRATYQLDCQDYSVSITGNAANGFAVTNAIAQESDVTAQVSKTWKGDYLEGTLPDSITAALYADNMPTGDTVALDADHAWSAEETDLPLYALPPAQGDPDWLSDLTADGHVISYSFKELDESDSAVADGSTVIYNSHTYKASYLTEESSTTITNTIADTTGDGITLEKVWQDDGESPRPSSVTVQLVKSSDGSVQAGPVTLSEEDDWTTNSAFSNVPIYDEDGNLIHYTLQEEDKDGNFVAAGNTITLSVPVSEEEEDASPAESETPVITYQNITYVMSASVDLQAGDATITNGQTLTISGTKDWVDGDNASDTRPDSVSLTLYNGDTAVDTTEAASEDSWNYSFKDLPAYDDSGDHISYTVKDTSSVDGYTMTQAGDSTNNYTIINTLDQVSDVSITISKVWMDIPARRSRLSGEG